MGRAVVSDTMTFSHFVFFGDHKQMKPLKNSYCATPGCWNGIGRKRAAYGHLVCKGCGEEAARVSRQSWTVIQEYGKGGYMYVPAEAAFTALRQTNQKQLRA